MAELERESAIVIRLEGQEGIGGSGAKPDGGEGQEGIGGSGFNPGDPPDGIGGTGIVGLVQNDARLSIGGIHIPSIDGATIYQDGNVLPLSAISSGQVAAVLLDNNDLVREIHVFDASDGLPNVLAGVETLIVRGELTRVDTGSGVTISGIAIPKAIASLAKSGEIIQLQGSAISAGEFRVDRAGPIQINRPLESQQGIVGATPVIRPLPADQVVNDVVVPDIPVIPSRPEQPQAVEIPTIPAPVTPQKPLVVPSVTLPPAKVVPPSTQPIDIQIQPTLIPNTIPDADVIIAITPASPSTPPAPPAPPAPPEPPTPPKTQPDTFGVVIQTDLTAPVSRP